MSRLAARDLTVDIGTVNVCRGLSFTQGPGQCWGLLGANGVGKTTLLYTLAGLRPPQGGGVNLDDHPVSAMKRRDVAQRIGFVFQDQVDPFPATVMETVLVGRHPHLRAFEWETARDRELALEALEALGMDGLQNRPVHSLSGGERRRAGIAALLVQQPAHCLLDEPTNHLDLHHRIRVLQLLKQWITDRGSTLMMSLHDVNLAVRFCDHVMLLYGEGRSECGPATEILTEERLTRVYGHSIRRVDSNRGPWFMPE